MSDTRSRITLKEFAEDAAHIVEHVASARESILIEGKSGEFVEMRYVPHHLAENATAKSQKTTEEKWQGILSVIGTWSDFDADAFLEENEKSRAINDRPLGTL